MTKRRHTIYGIIVLLIGVFGGIVGTAFSMGADKQRVNDILAQHTIQMATLVVEERRHEETTQKELDRFSEIIAAQITQLQASIFDLANTVSNLRTDVQVIKALIERMENDLRAKKNMD